MNPAMSLESDIRLLIERIRDAARGVSEGTMSEPRAFEQYRDLSRRYHSLEAALVSERSQGFVRGILHAHNRGNASHLSAVCILRHDGATPLLFAGDRLLLAAATEIISRERTDVSSGETKTIHMGQESGHGFFLVMTVREFGGERIAIAAVSSSPSFRIEDFAFTADLLALLFENRFELDNPFVLDYRKDISAEVSRMFRDFGAHSLTADIYRLASPPGSFSGIGIQGLIDFSNYIVRSLKNHYAAGTRVFALSPSSYVAIYPTEKSDERSNLEFSLQGTIIPYKITRHVLDTPRAICLIVDSIT